MTDLEISKALALAIGWKPEQIIEYEGQSYIGLPVNFNGPGIKLFDYRFTSVIWPIAERYNCFPYALRDAVGLTGRWNVLVNGLDHDADTAAKAVALAAIRNAA